MSFADDTQERSIRRVRLDLQSPGKNRNALKLLVDPQKNTVPLSAKKSGKAVVAKLKPNSEYRLAVEGEVHIPSHIVSERFPSAPVLITYLDGQAERPRKRVEWLIPGDEIIIRTPEAQPGGLHLQAFFLLGQSDAENTGEYTISLDRLIPARLSKQAANLLNINFGREPFHREVFSVLGGDADYWNFFDVREREKVALKMGNTSATDVIAELSENDGEWGIAGHEGVYHAYLYHNCRCVDLALTLSDLPEGDYDVLVYAHGDAPNQNAAIEIQCGEELHNGKSTINDGTDRYRSHEFEEGVQYVKYQIHVPQGEKVVITSRRDGSNLSMLNAIQLLRK